MALGKKAPVIIIDSPNAKAKTKDDESDSGNDDSASNEAES